MKLLLIAWLLLLTGCGFHLRGAVDLPEDMRRIALQGIPLNHPVARYMKQDLAFSRAALVTDPAKADVVLRILEIREERRVLSLDEHGKAIEFELIARIRFELLTPDNKVILPPQLVDLHRNYLNTQLQVIGKAQEESLLRQEMRREAVRTILRRIQSALSAQTTHAS